MIPSSYAEWYECITVKCGIELKREYIEKRLIDLNDHSRIEVKKILSLYGEEHLDRIILWFKKALKEAER